MMERQMALIESIYKVYSVAWAINIVLILFLTFKDREHITQGTGVKRTATSQSDTIGIILYFLAVILFYGSLIYCINSIHSIVSKIIGVVFCVLFFLENGIFILPSVKRFGKIISGKTTNGNMELKDHFSITILASVNMLIYAFKVVERVIIYGTACDNSFAGDIILAIAVFLSISICILFICVLLVLPLQIIAKAIQYIHNLSIIRKIGLFEQRIREILVDQVSTNSITTFYLKTIKRKAKRIFIVLLSPLVILTILLDILHFVLSQVIFLIIELCLYLFLFIKQIAGVVYRMNTRILSLSEKTVIAISFRIAIILGLGITVVLNRYVPVFRNYEESTSVVEFVSSTIIIPLILEWLLSFKPKWGNKAKMDNNDV